MLLKTHQTMEMSECTLLPITIKSADKDPETQRISYDDDEKKHTEILKQ